MSINFCSLDEAYNSYSMNDYTQQNTNDNYYVNYEHTDTQLSYTKDNQNESNTTKNIPEEYNNICDKIKKHIEECIECQKTFYQQHNKVDEKINVNDNNILIILLIILLLWLVFSKK